MSITRPKQHISGYLQARNMTVRELQEAFAEDGLNVTFEAIKGAVETLIDEDIIEVVEIKKNRGRVLGLFGTASVETVRAPHRHVSLPAQRACDPMAWIVATSGAESA